MEFGLVALAHNLRKYIVRNEGVRHEKLINAACADPDYCTNVVLQLWNELMIAS